MKTQALFTALSLSALIIGNAVAQTNACTAAGCSATITYTAKITESTCSVATTQPLSTVLDTITIDSFPTTQGSETTFGEKPLGITITCPSQMGIRGYVTQTIADTNNTDILVPNSAAGIATGAGFRLYHGNNKITLGESHAFTIRDASTNGTYNAQDQLSFSLTARYVNRTGTIRPGSLTAEGILHLSYN